MQLAKQHIDFGLYTNQRVEMLAFWQNEIGLPFDHLLKIGGGVHQLRHDVNGSVLKINASRNALPAGPAAGFRNLMIARKGINTAKTLKDPDGNRVSLIPPGADGVQGIGISIEVTDLAASAKFYETVLEGTPLGDNRYRFGDTVIFIEKGTGADLDAPRNGVGYRYMTIQVHSVDTAYAAILAAGGMDGSPPVTLGETARICFVRDPDGNWIEISQRKSLTGSLEIQPDP